MEVNYFFSPSVYRQFVDDNCDLTFMQSLEWADFERESGHEVIAFLIEENGKILASVQLVIISARRGKFAYLAHGPVFAKSLLRKWDNQIINENQDLKLVFRKIINELIQIAIANQCSFLRVSTTLADNEANMQFMKSMGARKAPMYLNSENAYISSVKEDEQEILARMRKTTRYLIKNAPKQKVKIRISTNLEDLEVFWKIYQETVKREKFTGFTYQFLLQEAKSFLQSGRAIFLFGTDEESNQVLGGALLLFSKNSAFYHQGASVHSKKPIMYLLHFQGMLEAKKRGCEFYNFWGVEKKGRTPSGWEGLSTFKKGFGGQTFEYLPSVDFPLNILYYKTYWIDTLQVLFRNLRSLLARKN